MSRISNLNDYIIAFIGRVNSLKYMQMLLRKANKIVYSEHSLQILAFCLVLLLAFPVFSLQEGTIPGDSFKYLELGRNIVFKGQYITSPDNHLFQTSYSRAPLMSILVALSFKLLGPSISSALLITKAAYFGSVVILYLLTRKLFDYRTGVVVVGLVSVSHYMVGFPAQIEIDQIFTYFILASIYLIIVAFDRNNAGLSFIAGVMLGFSFLTRENAILWLPVPLYLFLIVSKWRVIHNLICLFNYGIGFVVIGGVWWLYFYMITGDIFLFSDRTSLGKYLSSISVPLTGALILVILIISSLLIFRSKIKLFINMLSKTHNSDLILFTNLIIKVSPWLLWLLFTSFFTISLSRLVSWITSFGEIPLRMAGFKYWAKIRVLPEQPLLYYLLIPAIIILIIYILYKKDTGDLVLMWLLLAFVPHILTLAIEGQYIQPGRYGMWLFWIGYLVLARCILIILDIIMNLFRLPVLKKKIFSNIVLVPFIGYSVWVGSMIPTTYNYQQYLSPSYYNAKPIQETSAWINQNIPKGAHLGSSDHFLSAINYYTSGNYEMHRWFALRNDQSNRKWPFNREIELVVNQGELVFQDRIRKYTLQDILYLQHFQTTSVIQYGQYLRTYYSTISLRYLINYLEELEIDYLVLSEFSGHGNILDVMPDYFLDSPAFQVVYSTEWQEGNNIFKIYIFKIDRTRLEDSDYPITIASDVWPVLLNDSKNALGEKYNLSKVVTAFENRPIVFRPVSSINFDYYLQIAEVYLGLGKLDLATYEYHLALENSPDQAAVIAPIATNIILEYPENAGSWLIIGDILRLRGDNESAISAYASALSKPGGSKYTYSATYMGLGKVYSAIGESKLAVDNFEKGLTFTYTGKNEINKTILVNKGDYYQSIGDIDRAKVYYYQAFPEDDSIPNDTSDFRKVIDLIGQFDAAYITSSEADYVHPAVFILENQPRLVLFAHPTSSIKYIVQMPENTFLSFTPALAPSVWKFGNGDGVQFSIVLKDENGRQSELYSRYIDPKNIVHHRIIQEELINLGAWSGQTVELEFVTNPGPNNNIEFDWAAWVELHLVQPISYNFLNNIEKSVIEDSIPNSTTKSAQKINNDERSIIFQHPTSRIQFSISLSSKSNLYFGIGMNPDVWSSEKGDGMEFNIFVQKNEDQNTLYHVFNKYIDPKNNLSDRKWFDYNIILDEFGDQEVKIIFETNPGPSNDANYDWGGWSTPVLITNN
jgi:4-amino-4-deoxy-L-arabinose transferase-like glycosyltransferase